MFRPNVMFGRRFTRAPAPSSMLWRAVKRASWRCSAFEHDGAGARSTRPSRRMALTSTRRSGLNSGRSSSRRRAGCAVSSASPASTRMTGLFRPPARRSSGPSMVETVPGSVGSVSVPASNEPATLHVSAMCALAVRRCSATVSVRSSSMSIARRGASASTASVMSPVRPLKRPTTLAAVKRAGCASGPAMRPFSASWRIEKPPERFSLASAAISAPLSGQSAKLPLAKESPGRVETAESDRQAAAIGRRRASRCPNDGEIERGDEIAHLTVAERPGDMRWAAKIDASGAAWCDDDRRCRVRSRRCSHYPHASSQASACRPLRTARRATNPRCRAAARRSARRRRKVRATRRRAAQDLAIAASARAHPGAAARGAARVPVCARASAGAATNRRSVSFVARDREWNGRDRSDRPRRRARVPRARRLGRRARRRNSGKASRICCWASALRRERASARCASPLTVAGVQVEADRAVGVGLFGDEREARRNARAASVQRGFTALLVAFSARICARMLERVREQRQRGRAEPHAALPMPRD